MTSRNQREGYYVGRLSAYFHQGRRHVRSRIRFAVASNSATVPLMTRGPWLIGEAPADWRPAPRNRRYADMARLYRRVEAMRTAVRAAAND